VAKEEEDKRLAEEEAERKLAELRALEASKPLSKKEKKALEKKLKKEEKNRKKARAEEGPEGAAAEANSPCTELQDTAPCSPISDISSDSDDSNEEGKKERTASKKVKTPKALKAVSSGGGTAKEGTVSLKAVTFDQDPEAEESKWDVAEQEKASPPAAPKNPPISYFEQMQKEAEEAKRLRLLSPDELADDDSVIHNVPHTFKHFSQAIKSRNSSPGKGERDGILGLTRTRMSPQEKFAKIWGAGLSYEHKSPVAKAATSPGRAAAAQKKAAAQEEEYTFSSFKATRSSSPTPAPAPAPVVAAAAAAVAAEPGAPMTMTRAASPTRAAPKPLPPSLVPLPLPAVCSDLKALNVKKYRKALIQNYWKKPS
jgi:hypothetical protein